MRWIICTASTPPALLKTYDGHRRPGCARRAQRRARRSSRRRGGRPNRISCWPGRPPCRPSLRTLPGLGRRVVAELLQPVDVVVQHVHRALGREAQHLALELRVLVAVQEGLEVVLQIGFAQAVLLALDERGQVNDGALAAVKGGLVLVGHRNLGRLAGLDGGVDLVVHIVVRRAGDLGLGRDAVRIGLVELVQHPLQEVLILLRAVVPVGDRDILALQVNRVHFGRRLRRVVDLDFGRLGGRHVGRGLGRLRRLRGFGALVAGAAVGAAAAGALVGGTGVGVGRAHAESSMATTTTRLRTTNNLRDFILSPLIVRLVGW